MIELLFVLWRQIISVFFVQFEKPLKTYLRTTLMVIWWSFRCRILPQFTLTFEVHLTLIWRTCRSEFYPYLRTILTFIWQPFRCESYPFAPKWLWNMRELETYWGASLGSGFSTKSLHFSSFQTVGFNQGMSLLDEATFFNCELETDHCIWQK